MVQFKALSLMIAAIIILNNSKCLNDMNALKANQFDCKRILIFNSTDTIELKKQDYKIYSNSAGYNLSIINTEKLNAIKKIKKPDVEFCINEKRLRAKGNNVFRSSVPEDAEYFFPLNDQGFIFFVKENELTLRKIYKQ